MTESETNFMQEAMAPSAGLTDDSRAKSPRSLRRAAMDCLARREHSFFELKQKLQSKFPERGPDEIRHELERLRDENLQSDKRFVESFIRSRKSRGYGYQVIREELRRRFVAEVLIDSFLQADDEDWLFILNRLIEKRLDQVESMEFGSRGHLRLVRFLQRRGFAPRAIQAALMPYLSRKAG